MNRRTFVAIAASTAIGGAIALGIGVILLLTPVHLSLGGQSLGCGSALNEDYSGALKSSSNLTDGLLALSHAQDGTLSIGDEVSAAAEDGHNRTIAQQIADGCDSNIDTRLTWSWILIGVGGTVVLGVGVVNRVTGSPTTA